MTIATEFRRALGTMIVYGFPKGDVAIDLAIAQRLEASVLEILPHWPSDPDPVPLRSRVLDLGLTIHSAHGCWGGQSIRADRVDLGSIDAETWTASLDDLKRCVDWLRDAGGKCLVIHPGGLSEAESKLERGEALARGLVALADHSSGSGVTICVENMPPGVHPGSRMGEIAALVARLDRPEVALALDTGHARIANTVEAETLAAGTMLATTHVHDNDGKHDVHLPPGLGTIDWPGWVASLDAILYRGPIMLECIRHLRQNPETLNDRLIALLRRMTGRERS